MSTIWWTLDQARAWVTWRDEELVARVGPNGDSTYGSLARRQALYASADAAGKEINRDGNGGSVNYPTPEAVAPFRRSLLLSSTAYLSGEAAIRRALAAARQYPPRIGSPEDLYHACADGRVKAYGRIDSGKMVPIPPMEWTGSGPSKRWTEIIFKVTELRRKFSADPRNMQKSSELRQAPEREINRAITAAYDEAEAAGEKPPNMKGIVLPVQMILRAQGRRASGRQIQELARAKQHKNRRRKPGATLASEKRRLQR
jgi:hypothetical protein